MKKECGTKNCSAATTEKKIGQNYYLLCTTIDAIAGKMQQQ